MLFLLLFEVLKDVPIPCQNTKGTGSAITEAIDTVTRKDKAVHILYKSYWGKGRG